MTIKVTISKDVTDWFGEDGKELSDQQIVDCLMEDTPELLDQADWTIERISQDNDDD